MMVKSFFAISSLSFLFLLLLMSEISAEPCPFNEIECECSGGSGASTNSFSEATCVSKSSLPHFISPFSKFRITGKLTIRGDVRVIPARHFAAFERIDELVLEQTVVEDSRGEVVNNIWDSTAFAGVQIASLSVDGVDGVLSSYSIPSWMSGSSSFGDRLTSLSVSRCRRPVHLIEAVLRHLQELRRLRVVDCPIGSISFSGLSSAVELRSLTLSNASLDEFRVPSSGGGNEGGGDMSMIESLNLDHNGRLKVSGLGHWDILRSISLRGNSMSDSIQGGGLDGLSGMVEHLHLDHADLDTFPRRLLEKNRLSGALSLAHNRFAAIWRRDLEGGEDLSELVLRANPIAEIEDGAFVGLVHAVKLDLRHTHLQSIDLKMFAGVGTSGGKRVHVLLDHCGSLKSLSATDVSQLAPAITISLRNTSLETVDPSIGSFLSKDGAKLDLSDNVHLRCEGLQWMSSKGICPTADKVIIEGSKCADRRGMLLQDYLKTLGTPDACGQQQSQQLPAEAESKSKSKSNGSNAARWSIFMISVWMATCFVTL